MPKGKEVNIKSSAISKVRFDKYRIGDKNGTLFVTFTDGDVRSYHKVPEAVYEELTTAQSVGYYFNTFIRDIYSQTPV